MPRSDGTRAGRPAVGVELKLARLLRRVLSDAELTHKEFGRRIQANASYVSRVLRGETACGMRQYEKWLASMGFTVEVKLVPIPGWQPSTEPAEPSPRAVLMRRLAAEKRERGRIDLEDTDEL